MQNKLKTLQRLVSDRKLDALLIQNPVDLFYLTGLNLSLGYLVIRPSETILFVDARYFEMARKALSIPVTLYTKKTFLNEISGPVGFDSSFMTYEEYGRLEKDFPSIRWVAFASPLTDMRMYKTPDEISALRRAAELTLKGLFHVKGLLQEGISEEEIAFAFEWFCRKNGASGLSFDPIIAFGPNSAYPHHRAGKTPLQKGQVVLMDVGAIVDHYHADLTRTLFFGEADPKLLHLFHTVKRAQQKVIQAVRPGVLVGHLDKVVRQEFQSEGVEELFNHALGHGIGLETHEAPRIRFDAELADLSLKPGMVLALEPGLYLPSLGGIRLEEMVLVTETGHEILCGHAEF